MDYLMDHVENQSTLNLVSLEVKQPMLTHGHGKLDCTRTDAKELLKNLEVNLLCCCRLLYTKH